MEAILDCYFDSFFGRLDRGCLFSRYKRKQIVDYLKTVIEGCRRAEEFSSQEGCRLAVSAVIKYHRKHRNENGRICLLGKYHNVLYAGVRLCYDFLLEDSKTVCELLREIFVCEKTFERIFAGAIFGVKVSHFVAGWKSDFDDQNENISALVYFSHHSNKLREIYDVEISSEVKSKRFLDVPMTCVSNSSPLRVASQLPKFDIILLLLRYGCDISDGDGSGSSIQTILKYLDNENYPEKCVECLKIFLRVVPFVELETEIRNEIVPKDRSGIVPPRLKHLCRCRIRKVLYETWQLPYGIENLGLPKSLSNYLDLLED